MGDELEIRPAVPTDDESLRDLYRRSSLVWDADRDWLLARPELFAGPVRGLAEGRVRVAVDGDRVVGFATLAPGTDGHAELTALFVDPDRLRGGTGRRLVEDAVDIATSSGATAVDVVANPDAVGFYEAVGFTHLGPVPTAGRAGHRMTCPLRRDGSPA